MACVAGMRRLIFLLTGSREMAARNLLLAGALLLSFVLFLTARQAIDSLDFIPLYNGASCLIHGHDPYSLVDQQQQFARDGGQLNDMNFWIAFTPVYPPLTYVLLSLIALFRWPQATVVWLILNVLTFGAGAVAIIHAARPRFRWLAVLAVAAILATSHVLLALGQITLFDIGLLALGCALLLRNRVTLGCVLLGLAVALKPQLGGLILAYFLIPRRTRRPAAATLLLLVVASLAAGLWFTHRPQTHHWPAELRRNIAVGQTVGGPFDPRGTNPAAPNEMLNLQVLTSSLSHNPAIFNRTAWVIAGLTGAWLLVGLCRMAPGYERDCVAIAALAMLSLTFLYHRLYDMRLVLLTVPALVLVVERSRRWGAALLALSAFLLFSTSRMAMGLAGAQVWDMTAHHVALQILLARQQALAVILLAVSYTMLCWQLASQQQVGDTLCTPPTAQPIT